MVIKGVVKRGEYFDSVSLMTAAHKIKQIEGVIDAAVVMATAENRAILKRSGFLTAEFQDAQDTDLLIAVKTESEAAADRLLASIDQVLEQIRKKDDRAGHYMPGSLEGAVDIMPDANLVLISLPGRYAAAEAMKALKMGLHVMIFSDNVPLEKEIELKQYARQHNLLVMGPDCGTAIINGVPLAFANVVKRGSIGVAAASGTGLQEVTTLISDGGGGISQAIGTGGRDIKKEVGGIMLISALKALAEDKKTEVILLVSKPPHPDVLQKIGKEVKKIDKPVAAVFLGADPEHVKAHGMVPAADLEQGAAIALDLAGITGDPAGRFSVEMDIEKVAKEAVERLNDRQKYLRALFSGGTFCSETQLILKGTADLYSNAPSAGSMLLQDPAKSEKHTLLDLGADQFTVGRPHPMIDFSTRNGRIIREAKDNETAVILLDLVLGYGANRNPVPEIIPTLKEAKKEAAAIICSVTGTDGDPQNRSLVVQELTKAGVVVCRSNAESSRLCKKIIDKIVEKEAR